MNTAAERKLTESCATLTPLQQALAKNLLAAHGIADALKYVENVKGGKL